MKTFRKILSWISNRPKGHDWMQVSMRSNLFMYADGVVVTPIYQCLKCKVCIASDGTDNIKCEPFTLAGAWGAAEDIEIRSCEEEIKIAAMEEALE